MAADLFNTPKHHIRTKIYVVQVITGPIKVGIARDVHHRLKGMRASNPYDAMLIHAVPGTLKDERALHDKLQRARLSGEWFVDTTWVRETLNEHFGCSLPFRQTISADDLHRKYPLLCSKHTKPAEGTL